MADVVIRGLQAAREREQFERLAAFLPTVPELLCGVAVRPLTPRLSLELEAAGSPFLCGGLPHPADAAVLLWHVSVAKQERRPWWLSARRWQDRLKDRLTGQIATMLYTETCERITDWLKAAHRDGPGVSGEGEERESFACWVAGVVDYFASRYGWSDDLILDMPWRRLWQYHRFIVNRESGGKATFINALTDKARDEFLCAANAEAKGG